MSGARSAAYLTHCCRLFLIRCRNVTRSTVLASYSARCQHPVPVSPKLAALICGGSPFSIVVAPFHFSAYIERMSSRVRSSRPRNVPAPFIIPCRPMVAKRPPTGTGWAHELKHDGYRVQIHVRDGRVRLYTRNGADWSKHYPRIVEEASRFKGTAIIDAEVVCLSDEGVADFAALHSGTGDRQAVACAFDLLMLDGDDLRRRPLVERKAALRKFLGRSRGGI